MTLQCTLTQSFTHFCVSSISAWWFVWRFCYTRNVLLLSTHLMCTSYSISERVRTHSWFQPGSVKFILFGKYCCIDHMHMTSQKGAPACWGSNEALPRAPSPSMQPAGQPLHAIPPGWPGPAPMRSASTTHARSATSLDPQHGVVVMETWRQCIRSILLICGTGSYQFQHGAIIEHVY